MPNDHLSAGAFQAMTGLSAKALRLYGERDILSPASIDPHSGYRLYAREQLGHGMAVDLLRRAQVPLSELAEASDFPFERWRQTVALRRHMEDFYLEVAERVAAFDPEDFVAHRTDAPPVDWIGVVVDLAVPDDVEGRIDTFTGLAADMPAVEAAFMDTLDGIGVEPADVTWTMTPDAGGGLTQMVLARPGPGDAATRALVARRLRENTGTSLAVASGALPRRVEVTFTAASASADVDTPVDEAAAGYLHALAFEHHLARHSLTAIRPTARMVVRGRAFSPDAGAGLPIGVFDVAVA